MSIYYVKCVDSDSDSDSASASASASQFCFRLSVSLCCLSLPRCLAASFLARPLPRPHYMRSCAADKPADFSFRYDCTQPYLKDICWLICRSVVKISEISCLDLNPHNPKSPSPALELRKRARVAPTACVENMVGMRLRARCCDRAVLNAIPIETRIGGPF